MTGRRAARARPGTREGACAPARDKTEILATAKRKMEVLRWTVRMAKDRKRFTAAQFEFSALQLNECGRMVGGWLKSRGGGLHPPSPSSTSAGG